MTFSQSAPSPAFGLSSAELRAVSLSISQDFAPRYPAPAGDLRFSCRELLAISDEISRDFAPRAGGGRNLLVLPVDPRRLYVYWRLENTPLPQVADDRQALTLRLTVEATQPAAVTAEPAPVPAPLPASAVPDFFDIALDARHNSQQITLPAAATAAGRYRAVIGIAGPGQDFTPLAASNGSVSAPPSAPPAAALPAVMAAYLAGPAPGWSATSPASGPGD